jgi:Domain of unknown function (DUF1707)
MAGPGDELRTPAAGSGRMRVSNAEREQVIDTLKAAFVDGRLTKDELDTRVGLTIAARTYAELATVTADIPRTAEPVRVVRPDSGNKAAMRAVKTGACTITAATLAVSVVGGVVGGGAVAVIIAIMMVTLGALATAFVAAVITAALKLEARYRRRSGGQLPPSPSGGQAAQRPASADPTAPFPATGDGQQHTVEAARRRPRRLAAFPSVPLVT